MRKILMLITLALVFGIFGRLLYLVIPASGQFATFETVAADQCDRIEIGAAPEDIQVDHDTGIAYLPVADRRNKSDDRHVGIYVLDLGNPDTSARRLDGALPDGFTPHGVSLWRGPDGERRLFVVNHPRGKHSVEIFGLGENDNLTHLETITAPAFTYPNDIVAVGPRQFYMSNMQRAQGGISLTLELYLGLPVTDVVYFDGTSAVTAADGLITANGVNISADGGEFYVAEPVAQRINIFKRDLKTGKLSDRKRFSIGTGPDNIDIAPDGSLYIGAHPDLLAFTEHAADADKISPSHVIRLDPVSGKHETVFMSINGEIDGSSTGPYWNGNLLVGSVFEHHIMWCRDVEG